jgi:uncharacterized membrane protein
VNAPLQVTLPARAVRVAQASFFGLLVLAVLWEAWIAPLRPGGSWLVLKALPLLVLAPRIVRVDPKALQWAVLLVPFYLAEAAVRLFEPLPYRACALLELVLAGIFFVAAILVLQPYKRATRDRRKEVHP